MTNIDDSNYNSVAIFCIDATGLIIAWNEKMSEILGFTVVTCWEEKY